MGKSWTKQSGPWACLETIKVQKGVIGVATILERVKMVVVDRLSVEEDRVVPEASFSNDLEILSFLRK